MIDHSQSGPKPDALPGCATPRPAEARRFQGDSTQAQSELHGNDRKNMAGTGETTPGIVPNSMSAPRLDALEAENARRVGKVSEAQFAAKVRDLLALDGVEQCGWVTGPGRSGAIAAVYASHLLSIPFVPFGSFAGPECGRVLIVDTAALSGRTLRKAERKYRERNPLVWFGFNEPPVVRFWYEAPCPQIVRRPLESVPHG